MRMPELVRVADTCCFEEQGLPPQRCNLHHRTPVPPPVWGTDGVPSFGWGAVPCSVRDTQNALPCSGAAARSGSPWRPSPVVLFLRSPGAKKVFRNHRLLATHCDRLLRREQLELADALEPDCVHYWTQQEIASDCTRAVLHLEHYSEDRSATPSESRAERKLNTSRELMINRHNICEGFSSSRSE